MKSGSISPQSPSACFLLPTPDFSMADTGRNLDILARQPMWNRNMDYKCGTGHGVGYILNVHEGPQGIRWRYTEGQSEAVIEAGMDVTNEPGIYIEGSHGIRTENVMVARNGVKNGDGQFMYFDTLTWVPIRSGRHRHEVYAAAGDRMAECLSCRCL